MRHIFRTLVSKQAKPSINATGTNQLLVESLEDRQMLSSVSVFAMGATGGELINVQVNGQGTIAEIRTLPTDGFQEFQFSTDSPVSASDIRINFLNDSRNPSTGFDRNVFVDRIEIDGNIYQTENAAVFSTGTWRQQDGVQPGFGRGEALHSNGYLQYSNAGLSNVTNTTLIEAELEITGITNRIDVDVLIDNQVVDSWSLQSSGNGSTRDNTRVFSYRAQGNISPERIKLAFTNDTFELNRNGSIARDNNAQFNFINIDGVNYDPFSQNVFSTGTWRAQDGITSGFGRGNVLHANGFLQFSGTPNTNSGTQIVIDARGFGDVVDFELQIDEIAVASYSFTANTGYTQDVLTFNAVGDVAPERVRVVFTNDATFTDPATGASIDRNLQINSVTIDGVVFDPENDNVFSTGTYRPADGVTAGFGRGDFLHANGYLEFPSNLEVSSNPPVATRVIFENDFDQYSSGLYNRDQLDSDWNDPRFNDGVDEGRVSIVTGSDAFGNGSSLAVSYPEGEAGTKETGAQWQLELDGEYEEAFLSYRVKFADGFDFSRGGKLPGLAGGTAPTGNAPAEGDNGWTGRLMWLTDFNGEPGEPEQLVSQAISYAKYTDSGFDQDGRDEDETHWIDPDGDRTEFVSGQWYEITQRVKMNTPGVSDGVIQIWLDGQLVHDQTDVLFRTVPDLKIDQVYFSTFFGGGSGWETTKDETVFFDDFEVSVPLNS